MNNFMITDGKGFGITFENGWMVSVQWGPGNYCDNYSVRPLSGETQIAAGREGSRTAECAVISPAGDFVQAPGHNDVVTNRSTPAEVLALMNWAASQPKAEGKS